MHLIVGSFMKTNLNFKTWGKTWGKNPQKKYSFASLDLGIRK